MDDRYFLACLLDRQNILRIGFAWESDSSRLRLHLLLSGNELSTLYADLILCTNTTAIGKYDFCSAPISDPSGSATGTETGTPALLI